MCISFRYVRNSQCHWKQWNNTHENAAGIQVNNIDKFISYCNNLNLPEPSTDVVYSLDVNNINESLWDIFNGYDMLWSSVGLKQPLFHIHLDNINSNEIQQLKGSTIKFQYNDCTFIKFFVSNKEKQNYFLDVNTKIDIDIIGELGYNNFMGKQLRQCVISKMECKEHKEKEIDWDELFK